MSETKPISTTRIEHPDLFSRYAALAEKAGRIDPELYGRYNVKRGLRNADGSGVLVGLTSIGSVIGYRVEEQDKVPTEGRLIYRGIDVPEIVRGCRLEGRMGFEETAYLLLFGELPTAGGLREFNAVLDSVRALPPGFKEDAVLRSPSPDVMNKLARCVLAAYAYDPDPDGLSIENVLRHSLELIARFPTFVAYGYQAKAHYYNGESLHLHNPVAGKSTAEQLLLMLRPDQSYTRLEAELLDLCLILHAEHGGGNNSAFTTHVVTSSNTDTYSAIAAAVLSLKGPRHGGANLQVERMMQDLQSQVSKWTDEGQVADYLNRVLAKKAFDRSGLIYGLGHAVYTLSDPRTAILRERARELADASGMQDVFELYALVERLGPELFNRSRGTRQGLCINVDFYSGMVYRMMGIPSSLYTPIFAVSRVAGWCAHRLEELTSGGKIMRPAYKSVSPQRPYVPFSERQSD